MSERPLPLAGCVSLRAASGRAYVGSLRERSAPFEVPPDAGFAPVLDLDTLDLTVRKFS